MSDARYFQIPVRPVLSALDKVFVRVHEGFTDFIKESIVTSYGSLDAYNARFIGLEPQTFSWAFRAKNGHNLARFLRICRHLGIPCVRVSEQIQGYYSWGSHNPPVEIPTHIRVTPLLVEGYALYIAEGDTGDSGMKRPRKLRFTNAEPQVINFFSSWLTSVFPCIPFY